MAGYDWDPMNDTNCRETKFVEISAEFNLMRLVLSATRYKGNILDKNLSSGFNYQTHILSVLKNCLISDHHLFMARLRHKETIGPFREKTFFNNFNSLSAFKSEGHSFTIPYYFLVDDRTLFYCFLLEQIPVQAHNYDAFLCFSFLFFSYSFFLLPFERPLII